MPASSKTIVRGWGAVLGLEDVRKAYDARRRASFRGRLLSVVSVALVVSGLVVVVYGQINVYGVTTKSERYKRSYWTRTAAGNGIGGRKAPVPYGS